MSQQKVVLAGATGNQGRRTATALLAQGAQVLARVRDESSPGAQQLRAAGAGVVRVDGAHRR